MKHFDKFISPERAKKKYCIDCIYFVAETFFYDNSKCNYIQSPVDGSPKYYTPHMRDNICVNGKYWETNKIIEENADEKNREKEIELEEKRKAQIEEWKNSFPKNEIIHIAPNWSLKNVLGRIKEKIWK